MQKGKYKDKREIEDFIYWCLKTEKESEKNFIQVFSTLGKKNLIKLQKIVKCEIFSLWNTVIEQWMLDSKSPNFYHYTNKHLLNYPK